MNDYLPRTIIAERGGGIEFPVQPPVCAFESFRTSAKANMNNFKKKKKEEKKRVEKESWDASTADPDKDKGA
jgi:hypothetical protein